MSHPPMAEIAYGYNLGASLSHPDRPDWAQPASDNDELMAETTRQLLLAARLPVDGTPWNWAELLKNERGPALLTFNVDGDEHTFLAAWSHHAYAEAQEFDLPDSGPDVTHRLVDALRVLGVTATNTAPHCVLIPST